MSLHRILPFKPVNLLALYLPIFSLFLSHNRESLANGLAIEKLPGSQLPKTQEHQMSKSSSQSNDAYDFRPVDSRRPIWILDHMVNSIKELEYRLSKGANAIETDITFGPDGEPLYNYHGPPCDCWRHCNQLEDFKTYLSYVREISIDEPNGLGKNLTILFLDLKLDYLDPKSKAIAGTKLAESIVGNLFLDSEASLKVLTREAAALVEGTNSTASIQIPKPKNHLRLILSINHVTDLDLVNNFLHYMEQNNSTHLMDRIGFDVGMNDDIQQIESMWKRFGDTLNIWQGDGYTNCFSPFYNLQRLSTAIKKRNSVGGYPRKVYHWTIDLHDRMRESLKLGVDAIMTNHPERVLSVLREPELAHDYRLATREDDPFERIITRLSMRSGESARYSRSPSPSNGGFVGSLIDVLTSWYNFVKEIPLFSFPTTSRFLGKSKRHRSSPIVINSKPAAANQPEYRLERSDADNTTVVTEPEYDGPKWYTSLASTLLISVMKIILPSQH